MEKKFEDFDMQQAMRMASSDVGKQLMALLQDRHSEQMQAVMDNVRSGDMELAKQSLSAFMADPKTKALLKQLQEEQNGRNGR